MSLCDGIVEGSFEKLIVREDFELSGIESEMRCVCKGEFAEKAESNVFREWDLC